MINIQNLESSRAYLHANKLRNPRAAKPLLGFFFALLIVLLAASCNSAASTSPGPSLIWSETVSPTTQTPSPKASSTPSPAPAPEISTIWIQENLPAAIGSVVSDLFGANLTNNSQAADLKIIITNQNPIGTWFYALVAPFPSLRTNINLIDLKDYWLGKANDQETMIYTTSETAVLLNSIWGERSSNTVTIVDEDQLLSKTWTDPGNLAIIPLDHLQPHWKLISINGISPLENDSLIEYPLSINFSFQNETKDINTQQSDPITNFSPDELTRVAMTGVTALVRDTAAIMEDKGVLYPGEDVRDILRGADLTHISNEVPFAEDCPTPDPNQESLYFCSSDSYLALLEDIGTDIIELSGDHFGDWGAEAMIHTLQLYHEQGWLTYGGGATYEQGIQPVFITHNGNKLAFIGCNGKSHERYATASETNPGASSCDFTWMIPKIAELSNQGYLVIATMQHEEIDSYSPVALQIFDFGALADAGAKIVSGSQAHHPQGFELSPSALIHYGLGNLFFDQWYLAKYNPEQHENKDKGFIDIHSFYRGRYVNTELIPIQFIDNAKPRPMTSEEAGSFLIDVFNSSSWILP